MTKIGFKNAFKKDKTKATITALIIELTVTPGNIFDNTITAIALNNIFNINLIIMFLISLKVLKIIVIKKTLAQIELEFFYVILDNSLVHFIT